MNNKTVPTAKLFDKIQSKAKTHCDQPLGHLDAIFFRATCLL